MKNLNFVIPFFFKGAPRETVMLKGELRFVRNKKSKKFGKVVIYTDSFFAPLNFEEPLSIKDAITVVEKKRGYLDKRKF